MVGAVDTRNLGKHVTHFGYDDLRAVDDGLSLVLDLQ
jgi:hypothetical protein